MYLAASGSFYTVKGFFVDYFFMPEFLSKKMIILKAVNIMCKRVVEIYLSIVLLIIFRCIYST